MSLGAVKNDFWQLTSTSTIKERCKSIFNQELLSDVKFVVRDSQGGSESKKIPAHKFVLAISSPVFFAIFYGELAETKDSVEISDCDYESLLELFRFMYSDDVFGEEIHVAFSSRQMLRFPPEELGRLKRVSRLARRTEIRRERSVGTLLENNRKRDGGSCEISSDGFVTIERSVLEELVEKDSLNIKEVELFKAVDCWAEKECEKQGLVAEGSVKRRILGERILKGIRFALMEQKEFASVVLDCDILSKKELVDLMKYFNGVLTIPVGFSGAKRTGQLNVMSRFKLLRNQTQFNTSEGRQKHQVARSASFWQ